jgi:hypothetical protein
MLKEPSNLLVSQGCAKFDNHLNAGPPYVLWEAPGFKLWCILDRNNVNVAPRFADKPGAVFGTKQECEELLENSITN